MTRIETLNCPILGLSDYLDMLCWTCLVVQTEIPNEDHNCINYNTHVELIFASS